MSTPQSAHLHWTERCGHLTWTQIRAGFVSPWPVTATFQQLYSADPSTDLIHPCLRQLLSSLVYQWRSKSQRGKLTHEKSHSQEHCFSDSIEGSFFYLNLSQTCHLVSITCLIYRFLALIPDPELNVWGENVVTCTFTENPRMHPGIVWGALWNANLLVPTPRNSHSIGP